MNAAYFVRLLFPYLLLIASALFVAIVFSAVSFGGVGLFVLIDLLTN